MLLHLTDTDHVDQLRDSEKELLWEAHPQAHHLSITQRPRRRLRIMLLQSNRSVSDKILPCSSACSSYSGSH